MRPDTLSTHEAAEQLGVSRSTLLRWFRQGRVSAVGRDHNGWRLFSRIDVERIRRELDRPRATTPSQVNPRLRSYLRSVPTFRNLPQPVLDQLADEARFQGFLRGQHIFAPGETSRGLYIVVKGRVRVFRMSLEGREQTLRVAVPFETLGESVLFRSGQRHASHALCLESSTVIILALGRLLPLTEAYPVLAQAFLREFSERIQDLEERLEETALLSLEQRLAKLLLEAESMSLSSSPRELAAYLGAARESVNRVLLRFAKDGIIGKDGRSFRILDRHALDSL
jgi:excisionase family DNA binding protein